MNAQTGCFQNKLRDKAAAAHVGYTPVANTAGVSVLLAQGRFAVSAFSIRLSGTSHIREYAVAEGF